MKKKQHTKLKDHIEWFLILNSDPGLICKHGYNVHKVKN